jgi:hypothetical protein
LEQFGACFETPQAAAPQNLVRKDDNYIAGQAEVARINRIGMSPHSPDEVGICSALKTIFV